MEQIIFANLLFNENYAKSIVNFLKEEYFTNRVDKLLYSELYKYIQTYNEIPSKIAIQQAIDTNISLNEKELEMATQLLNSLEKAEVNDDWLLKNTEKWGKERALYNAIREGIAILDDKSGKKDPNCLPDLMQKALSVSLDKSIGHDYFPDWTKRYEMYHQEDTKVKTDIEYFNKITNGGFSNKTLNVFMGPIGGGKSLTMCSLASGMIKNGYNVLYITCEMAEERIAERIDANLLDVEVDDLPRLDKKRFSAMIDNVRKMTASNCVIKYFPGGHAGHFRFLLNELKMKRQFVPNIIFIDYLGICSSFLLPASSRANQFLYVKSISEEIRNLAGEYNVPIVSACQYNREGFRSSDPSMDNVAESFGLPATTDLLIALIKNDELSAQQQILCSQLKNRYRDENKDRKFILGIDKPHMRLYNILSQQGTNISDGHVPHNPPLLSPMVEQIPMTQFSKFSGFKV